MKTERLRLLVGALVACFLLPAVTVAQEKLVLGYTNFQGAKIPVPVGKEAGLFGKHGLELAFVRVTPGHTAIPKLLSGEIHIFLGNGAPVVKAIVKEQAKLAIVASLGEDSFELVGRAPIRTAEGLKGKRVGISNIDSSADRIARLALKSLGLEPGRDVQLVATGLSESRGRLELVVKGELDATVVSTENVVALGERRAAIFPLAELEHLGIYVSGADLSVSRSLIEHRRETLKRFLSALIDAIGKAKEDLDLTRRIYRQYAKVTDPLALEWRVREFLPGRIPKIPYPNRRAIESYLQEAGARDSTSVEAVADFTMLQEIVGYEKPKIGLPR